MANVTTPPFRVSYPNLFQPKKNELNGKDEYSVVALFPKDADLSKLKAAAQDAIVKKWGPDKAKWPQNLRTPFRDQGERAKDGKLPGGYEAGAIYLNLKSSMRPGIVGPDVQPIMDQTEIYAGCWARALVNVYAYDQKGNRGVSFSLQHIQKLKDGDPLGGRMRVEDAFTPVASEEPGDAPATATDLFK